MISISDIHLVYSGGAFNIDPMLSLGGPPSSTPILGSINNLFNNISITEQQTGLTDYRCFYVVNNNATDGFYQVSVTISGQISGGAEVTLGITQATEIQNVIIDNSGVGTGPSLLLNGDFGILGSDPSFLFDSWKVQYSSTPVLADAIRVQNGIYSAKWQGHADALTNPNLLHQEFVASPNTIYTVTYWALGEPGSENVPVPQLLDANMQYIPGQSSTAWNYVGDGVSWYQITIYFDPTPNTLPTPTLRLVFSDEFLTNPAWIWYLDDVSLSENSFYAPVISYELSYSSVPILVSDQTGIALQNALNTSGFFTGAVVTSIVDLTTTTHTIRFENNDDFHYYSLLTSNTAKVTTEKVQNGSPVNYFPDLLTNRFTPPGNVDFDTISPIVNELRSAEVIPIWVKRTIAPNQVQQDNDGFTLHISGNVFSI